MSREEARTLTSPQLRPKEFFPSSLARGPDLLAPGPLEGLWSSPCFLGSLFLMPLPC